MEGRERQVKTHTAEVTPLVLDSNPGWGEVRLEK